MASLNKVELIGYLGKKPELRYMPNGDPVATVQLGTTEAWKDKSGERKERTEWHRLIFFGKLAEDVVAKFLDKGSHIYAEGRLRTRKWTDKDKIDRYTTEIICDEMKMLDRKPASDILSPPADTDIPVDDDIPF